MTETATNTAPVTAESAADEAFDMDAIAASVRAANKVESAESAPDAIAAKVSEYAAEAAGEEVKDEAPAVAEGVTLDESVGRYRDASGKFVKADGSPDPDSEAAAPPDPSEPTTETADAKEAATKAAFVAYGTDGTPLTDIPVAEVEFKVAGEVKKLPLDRVIRMAQSGGYNETLQHEVKETREYGAKLEQYANEVERVAQQKIQMYESHLARLLKDPEFYLAETEQFDRAQAPEAEADRLRREVQELRNREQQQTHALHLAHATEQTLLPKFEEIVQQYPEVAGEEVLAYMESLILPYRQHGGPVDPRHVPQIAALLDRAVAPYAAQLHEARTEAKALKAQQDASVTAAQAAAQREAADAAKKAKAQAQQQVSDAKKALARQIAPTGGVGTNAPARPKPVNYNDTSAVERMVRDAVNAIA